MSQDFPFNPKAVAFDISNAYSLAKVSQLAYTRFEENEEARAKVISQAQKWGFTEIYLFDHRSLGKDSEAIILADADKIILSFRGTEPTQIADWITDLQFKQIEKLNGKVHRGFYEAFEKLWISPVTIWKSSLQTTEKNYIKNILQNLLTSQKRPIWFTGHSLGGALAVLGAAACGLELKEQFQPQISLYTYGQPRVGDKNFNNTLLANTNSRIFRVVNNNDIVARIPVDIVKKITVINYAHVGKLIYLDTEKKVHLQDLGWWQQTKDELLGRLEDIGKPGTDGIKDHDLSEYVRILKGALDNPNNIIK